MELSGKVAIVTGAGGGGSGRAIAKRLARDGAFVVLSDIEERGGRETLRLIEARSEEHTSELQSQSNLVCRLLLEKKKQHATNTDRHPPPQPTGTPSPPTRKPTGDCRRRPSPRCRHS